MSPALLKEIAALADKMRAKASRHAPGDCAARACCYAMPTQTFRVGFNHLAVWPGLLDEFRPGDDGDNLRVAAAYLLLEIERLERPAEATAA